MPYDEKLSFSIRRLQILDDDGNCNEREKPQLKDEDLKKMYELMVTSRIFDNNALKLQREGRIGTYASIRGQEASQVGSAYALQKDDWMFPAFREGAAYLARGMPMHLMYAYWAGDERGNYIPKDINCFSVSIPVGTQPLHAVGFAIAAKLKKEKYATLVYFGDGATSEGDTMEAMNFAGVFKAPVVFICQNNQWAISVPLKRQTASQIIAQKSIAFGFDGIQVDGNDVFAVYKATQEALEKAKQGNGPTLVECLTYRLGDHTTADDAKRYRSDKELEEWRKKDPIERLRKYMEKKRIWNAQEEKRLINNSTGRVMAAIKAFEDMPEPKREDMFRYVYEKPTSRLEEQMKEYEGGAKK
ncbi:MAG: pyruvate dehydrogenase (acetyl-transferring) E1 component subunit alpha [Candidatus Aenigmarchaeota archaeon]|nr:pyruvate dehydrogenase (acetyl-transferring) E1 component subunit alpha [Candidatus Aenigmarchaeota archaeon]MDI6722026.1 pyruvate dehydrogenase (acetyl-transferring) E1 component subunit alpha [Candidatus Aenigmarchaeota archaeon]